MSKIFSNNKDILSHLQYIYNTFAIIFHKTHTVLIQIKLQASMKTTQFGEIYKQAYQTSFH